MKNWKIIVGVLAVFLLGMMAGGLVTVRIVHRRMQQVVAGGPEAVADGIARRLAWRLRLDGAQRSQVRGIVHDAAREMAIARRQVAPQMEQIFTNAVGRVRATLRPEQQEKFDRLVQEGRSKWQP